MTTLRPHRTRRGLSAVALATSVLLVGAACSNGDDTENGDADTTTAAEDLPFEQVLGDSDEPMLADAVVIPEGTAMFKTAGIGPSALNDDAEEGDPMSFVDPALLVDGELPDGMTVTEAQGLGVIQKIRELLQEQGLDVQDVATMRVFLQGIDGEAPDVAGWNRAYRQYFANTNLRTGEPMQLARGESEVEGDPEVINPTRPSRFALGVAYLPVDGWLVEVEVDAPFVEDE